MLTGILGISLEIYASYNLKDKRRVIESIIERTKHKYNVSVAEVGKNESWNRAEIGIAIVSNNRVIIESTFTKIVNNIDDDSRVEIIEKSEYIEKI